MGNFDHWNKQQKSLTALFALAVHNTISVFPPINAPGAHSVSSLEGTYWRMAFKTGVCLVQS